MGRKGHTMALFRLDDDSDASLNDREQHEDHEEDNGSSHGTESNMRKH